ncbi:hypothetical protein B9Z19DRAFT_1087791 [Tuber borchii]|uniref:Uncharacterized protein n=1 Tax=Tuber borchii TaxID=42251 RepID=A0A2T6ZMH1_TUBBO|nr:hypothetical protein B9Z19DRAFT_1087791 [Tuber borchii]
MFSTPISAVLFALLVVVLQTFTAVSVLPTSTATTSTITGTPATNTSTSTITMNASAQPQTGRASGSSWNNNNNNRSHRNIAPPNNTREFAVRAVSSSISPLFRKAPGITPPNPVSVPVNTLEGSSAIPAPEIPIPRPVLIYNDYSNTHFLGACSNTFLYNQNRITGEDGRVLQPEELLAPRRPERTLTYPLT